MGRITLLKNQLEEKNESMGHILNDDAFSRSLANCTEAAEAFRLQEFMLLNEKLIDAQRKWNIPGLRVACAKVSDFIVRTKAITPSGTVEFDDPVHSYPSEGLMTKLIMIAPENTK